MINLILAFPALNGDEVPHAGGDGVEHLGKHCADGANNQGVVGVQPQHRHADLGDDDIVGAAHRHRADAMEHHRYDVGFHHRPGLSVQFLPLIVFQIGIHFVHLAGDEQVGAEHTNDLDNQVEDVVVGGDQHCHLEDVLDEHEQAFVDGVQVVFLVGGDEGPLVGKKVTENGVTQKQQVNEG